MKKLIAFAALVLVALAPAAAAAQTPAGFAGKWEGTYTLQKPDGTSANPRPIVFDFTQKGKALDGMAGPPNDPGKIAKGAVAAGKATFDVPLSDGSIFRFALTIVKGRLQGDMTGLGPDGTVKGKAKVDAAKAAPAVKKIAYVTLLPAAAAAQAAPFSGKWEGTFKRDGGPDNNVVFNLTQKGKVLTGTAGPGDQMFPVTKGVVTAGKATFEVQQPNGPLFKFTLTIVKGRLTGDMVPTGPNVKTPVVLKVDAGKAPAAAKK